MSSQSRGAAVSRAHLTVTQIRRIYEIPPRDEPLRPRAEAIAGGGRRLAVNVLAGGLANILKIGLNLVMLPLMAHLLGPPEFGLYALALPTIAFCMILADGGLGASLAREPLESRLVWSSGFWLVLAVGVGLALTVVVWGVALAEVTHEPRVSGLMNLLSLSLVMISLSALPNARLTREARLTVFAVVDISSTAVGAAAGVILALEGFGAKSLAAQYVVNYTLRAVLLNAAAFVPPRFEFQFSALKTHLSMGSALLGVRMSDFLGRIVENVLYGRTFGAAGLGVYTFANQAPRFITEAAAGPIWAALYAFALREPSDRLAAMHVNLVRLLASLVFPAAALLSATAPQLLVLILGPSWAQAGNLLKLLVPFYALGVLSGQSGAVLLARNKGWLWFWCSLLLTIGRVAAVALGRWTGQTGVALGVDAALAVNMLAMFAAAGHVNGTRRLIVASAPPAAAALVGGAAAFLALGDGDVGLPALVLSWILGGLVYVAALALFGMRTLRADLATARAMLARFRTPRMRRGEAGGV